MRKEVWIFGNPDFKPDALPLQIPSELKKRLPQYEFVVKDPNEEWDLSHDLIIIDTVQGLKKITTFTSLDQFTITPNLTVHDFDLLTNLRWLNKLGKLPPFLIVGLPPDTSASAAIENVVLHLTNLQDRSNMMS